MQYQFDCELGPWSEWSRSGEYGYVVSERSVLRHSLNGGRDCGKDETTKARYCLVIYIYALQQINKK